MPTKRPRHIVTETDDIAAALDAAAERWPEDAASRARLLLRLVRAGHRAMVAHEGSILEERLEALLRNRGSLGGCYPAGYLDELREDWPA